MDFFFPAKSIFVHLILGLREGSRVVKKLTGGWRERLRQKLAPGRCQRSPSWATGLQTLLVLLEIIAQPSLGGSQVAAGLMVATLWMTFTSSSGSGFPGSHRDGGLHGRNPGMQTACFRFSSRTMVTSMVNRVLLHSSWDCFYISWKRAQPRS